MFTQHDLDILWQAHQKTKEASNLLKRLEGPKTNHDALEYRKKIAMTLRKSRVQMQYFKKFIKVQNKKINLEDILK